MSNKRKLNGLYVISDDTLTPSKTIKEQITLALKGGAKIVQLRDKTNPKQQVKDTAIMIQNLCKEYEALFVLNDDIDLAIELQCDGLHIGKSDYDRFEEIRKGFKGIIGVSCYGDIKEAKSFEQRGADYVAFGSFFTSPTKPNSKIVPLKTISMAKKELTIPVCAIGGINTQNLKELMEYKPDMVSIITDIWKSEDISKKANFYSSLFYT